MQASSARAFACAPGLKIEAQERLSALQFQQIHSQLERLETTLTRLEKRIWLTVYGVVAAVLAQAFRNFSAGGN